MAYTKKNAPTKRQLGEGQKDQFDLDMSNDTIPLGWAPCPAWCNSLDRTEVWGTDRDGFVTRGHDIIADTAAGTVSVSVDERLCIDETGQINRHYKITDLVLPEIVAVGSLQGLKAAASQLHDALQGIIAALEDRRDPC